MAAHGRYNVAATCKLKSGANQRGLSDAGLDCFLFCPVSHKTGVWYFPSSSGVANSNRSCSSPIHTWIYQKSFLLLFLILSITSQCITHLIISFYLFAFKSFVLFCFILAKGVFFLYHVVLLFFTFLCKKKNKNNRLKNFDTDELPVRFIFISHEAGHHWQELNLHYTAWSWSIF